MIKKDPWDEGENKVLAEDFRKSMINSVTYFSNQMSYIYSSLT